MIGLWIHKHYVYIHVNVYDRCIQVDPLPYLEGRAPIISRAEFKVQLDLKGTTVTPMESMDKSELIENITQGFIWREGHYPHPPPKKCS